MKLEDGISDAVELSKDLHRKMKELQKAIDELEYLIYSLDDRVQIEFFKRGENDKEGSKEGIKAD